MKGFIVLLASIFPKRAKLRYVHAQSLGRLYSKEKESRDFSAGPSLILYRLNQRIADKNVPLLFRLKRRHAIVLTSFFSQ